MAPRLTLGGGGGRSTKALPNDPDRQGNIWHRAEQLEALVTALERRCRTLAEDKASVTRELRGAERALVEVAAEGGGAPPPPPFSAATAAALTKAQARVAMGGIASPSPCATPHAPPSATASPAKHAHASDLDAHLHAFGQADALAEREAEVTALQATVRELEAAVAAGAARADAAEAAAAAGQAAAAAAASQHAAAVAALKKQHADEVAGLKSAAGLAALEARATAAEADAAAARAATESASAEVADLRDAVLAGAGTSARAAAADAAEARAAAAAQRVSVLAADNAKLAARLRRLNERAPAVAAAGAALDGLRGEVASLRAENERLAAVVKAVSASRRGECGSQPLSPSETALRAELETLRAQHARLVVEAAAAAARQRGGGGGGAAASPTSPDGQPLSPTGGGVTAAILTAELKRARAEVAHLRAELGGAGGGHRRRSSQAGGAAAAWARGLLFGGASSSRAVAPEEGGAVAPPPSAAAITTTPKPARRIGWGLSTHPTVDALRAEVTRLEGVTARLLEENTRLALGCGDGGGGDRAARADASSATPGGVSAERGRRAGALARLVEDLAAENAGLGRACDDLAAALSQVTAGKLIEAAFGGGEGGGDGGGQPLPPSDATAAAAQRLAEDTRAAGAARSATRTQLALRATSELAAYARVAPPGEGVAGRLRVRTSTTDAKEEGDALVCLSPAQAVLAAGKFM